MAKGVYGFAGFEGATEIVFTDEWMGDSSITVTWEDAYSHNDVPATIEYGGDVFTRRVPPTIKQQGKEGHAVNSFVTTAKYYSVRDELARVRFLDVVPADNGAVFSSMPDFTFWATKASTLLERIAANLSRAGVSGWTFSGGDENLGGGGQLVSVSNISCWDALGLIQSQFGLNFFISGRSVSVGSSSGGEAPDLNYGKGNGLYWIENGYDDSQYFVTRLYAYGNKTNMPLHYYMNMAIECIITASGWSFDFGTILSSPDDLDVPEEPVKPDPPTHEWMPDDPEYIAWEEYHAAMKEYEEKMAKIEPIVTALEEVGISQADIANFRNFLGYVGSMKCWTPSEQIMPQHIPNFHNREHYGTFKIGPDRDHAERVHVFYSNEKCFIFGGGSGNVFGVNKSTWPHTEGQKFPNNMNVTRLMLPGFWTENPNPYVEIGGGTNGEIVEEAVVFDGSNDLPDIYPSIKYLRGADNSRLDITLGASGFDDSADGEYGEGATIPNFTILIPDIGFDITDYVESTPTITLNTGMCAGRSFEILDCQPSTAGDKPCYALTCKRVSDNDLYFPNAAFPVGAGQDYVLTGIFMPDEYIVAASKELERQALLYLQKVNKMSKKVSMEVDPLHSSKMMGVRAGMTMKRMYIDSITMTFRGDALPQCDISLTEEKTESTLQRKLNSSSGLSTGNYVEGFMTYGTVAPSLLPVNYTGNGQYISRVSNDVARGHITFSSGVTLNGQSYLGDKGLKSRNYSQQSGIGIYKDPNSGLWYINTDMLNVRYKATFTEVEIQKVSHIGGQIMLSAANGVIDHVAGDIIYFKAEDSDGRLVDNLWQRGDIVYCQTGNLKKDPVTGKTSNRAYKFVVDAVIESGEAGYQSGYNAIRINKGATKDKILAPLDKLLAMNPENDFDMIAACDPAAGDDVVQCGNTLGLPGRTTIIVIAGAGGGAPYIYMWKNVVTYEMTKPFIKLDDEPELWVKSLTIGATDVGDAMSKNFDIYTLDVDAPVKEGSDESADIVDRYVSPVALGTEGWPDVEESWTEDSYPIHSEPGDVAVTKDGVYYRFQYDAKIGYGWFIIADVYLVQALSKANDSLDTLEDMASDDVITRQEMSTMWDKWVQIQTEYSAILIEATNPRQSGNLDINSACDDLTQVYGAVYWWMVNQFGLPSNTTTKPENFGTYVLIGQYYYLRQSSKYNPMYGQDGGAVRFEAGNKTFYEIMRLYYLCYCDLRKLLTAYSIDFMGHVELGNLDEQLQAQIENMYNEFMQMGDIRASLLKVESDYAALSTWAHDEFDKVYGSGFVSRSDFASVFSEVWDENGNAIAKATLSTFIFDAVDANGYGFLKSGIRLKADQIDIEGYTTFKAAIYDWINSASYGINKAIKELDNQLNGEGGIGDQIDNLDEQLNGEDGLDNQINGEGGLNDELKALKEALDEYQKTGELLEILKVFVLQTFMGIDKYNEAIAVEGMTLEKLWKSISDGESTILGGFIKTNLLAVDEILGKDATFSGRLRVITKYMDDEDILAEQNSLYEQYTEEGFEDMDAYFKARTETLANAAARYDNIGLTETYTLSGDPRHLDTLTLPVGEEHDGRRMIIRAGMFDPKSSTHGAIVIVEDEGRITGIHPDEFEEDHGMGAYSGAKTIKFDGGVIELINFKGDWVLVSKCCFSFKAFSE
ncbi:MAG: hypothetical protein MJZ30_06115 [Paludibacteraceae bacterium]|nr:hypothetical protein [Paludibacteraceae bacterium]